MRHLDRRDFLKTGLRTGAGVMLFSHFPGLGMLARADGAPTDDHFFLLVTAPYPSGMDCTYMFDARPLDMTAKGLLQNYRKTGEPAAWTGANGQTTLATEIVKPLVPYRSRFSVLNGVQMAMGGFDGHDQNFNYLFTGNAFGGEGFVPHLNAASRPLDAIQKGTIRASLTNASGTVPLGTQAAANLVKSLAKVPPIAPGSSLYGYLLGRFNKQSGNGAEADGSRAMGTAWNQSPALAGMLGQLQVPQGNDDPSFVKMIGQFFRSGAARSAIIVPDTQAAKYDTHDPLSASQQPQAYDTWMNAVALIFKTLTETPFDDTRSLFDVTTILVSAEFSRTMKQNGLPVEATGTNHNTMNNSVLVGGKGITGGLVIGASDFSTATETLSPAHLSLDAAKLKLMGRPFDFDQCVPRTDLPAQFAQADYLGFNNVVNTLYSLYGVPQKKWRLIERNGKIAPVVRTLLA